MMVCACHVNIVLKNFQPDIVFSATFTGIMLPQIFIASSATKYLKTQPLLAHITVEDNVKGTAKQNMRAAEIGEVHC